MIVEIAQLASAIAWPIVAMVIALVFRGELKNLVRRVRKGGGVEFDPAPQALPTAGKLPEPVVAGDQSLPLVKTPATEVWEQFVLEGTPLKEIRSPEARERYLVNLAARSSILWKFEALDGNIWASQIALLHHLNTRPQGEDLSSVRELFYEPSKLQYPDAYENYAFDGWLGFINNHFAVLIAEGRAAISPLGTEYLAWRVEQRRPAKQFG